QHVWDAAAAALGVRESAAEPLRETVLRHLGTRDSLLLLDNCEHVISGAAELAEAALQRGARLRVVATSREPLSIYGEVVWRDPEERRLFDRLSVFAGGFDLDAAEAVEGGPVLNLLASLVDRSLVIAEPRGAAMHYRLLDVLRQYGNAQLVRKGEVAEVRRLH